MVDKSDDIPIPEEVGSEETEDAIKSSSKGIPRRALLGGVAAGLVAGSASVSLAETDIKLRRGPIRAQVQRRTSVNKLPQRTVKFERAGTQLLSDRFKGLLSEDIRVDPDRVKLTVKLFQQILTNMAPRMTGLISVTMGPMLPEADSGCHGFGPDGENKDCPGHCDAHMCPSHACTGNSCNGHTCDNQACSGNTCSGQSCGQNGCHEQVPKEDIAANLMEDAWNQLSVLKDMQFQLDNLFVEITHMDVGRLGRYSY